jgi:uncharacterized membrane protein
MLSLYNRLAGQGLERLTALSDGVFAFAMTVLVLDIRVPKLDSVTSEHDLWLAILAQAPRFVMYLMSFLTLGIFWVGQQTQLNHIKHSDRDFAWIHIIFLATIGLVPFTTALLAEYITYRTALLVYWFNIVLLGAEIFASWTYAVRRKLVKDDAPKELSRAMYGRVIIAQCLYAFGAALCVFDTYWSIGFIVAVQLYYAFAPFQRLTKRGGRA